MILTDEDLPFFRVVEIDHEKLSCFLHFPCYCFLCKRLRDELEIKTSICPILKRRNISRLITKHREWELGSRRSCGYTKVCI